MEFYYEIKDRILAGPSAATDLSEFHMLLQREYTELLNFVAFRDASLVRLACDGFGTDDELLIKVLCSRTRTQLQHADRYFREAHPKNKSIRDIVSSETSGNYGKFMCSIVQSNDTINGNDRAISFI